MIEGEIVDLRRFVKWMLAYTNTREALGQPTSIKIDPLSGLLTTWRLDNQSELIFWLAAGEPDRIKWSRELRHIPSGESCGATERSTRDN